MNIVDVIKQASMQDQVRIAKMVRALYVQRVGNTEVQLDPTLLRKLDAKIAEEEAKLT